MVFQENAGAKVSPYLSVDDRVLLACKEAGQSGLSKLQVSELLNLPYDSAGWSINRLAQLGKIRKSLNKRRPGPGGKSLIAWVAAVGDEEYL